MKKVFILFGIFTMFIFNSLALSAAQVGSLNRTSWELTGIRQDGINLQIPRNTKITINFSGNKINGFSGINRYDGNYRIRNKSIFSANVNTTLMAGPENLMNIEMAFLNILQSSPGISYNQSTLSLRTNNGDSLTFRKSSNSSSQSNPGSLSNLSRQLDGTEWTLLNMAGKEVKNRYFPNSEGITISFSGSRLSGNAGINSYSADFVITAGNIVVGTANYTQMAGSDSLMKLENEYLNYLQKSQKIKIVNGTTLVLTASNGKTLTFRKN